MKKYIILLAAMLTVMTVAGCSKDGENSSAGTNSSSQAESSEVTESSAPEDEDDSPYTVNGDFSKGASGKFTASNGWSNGNMFHCTWKAVNCVFEDGVMKMRIDKDFYGDYTAAEYATNDFYGYGLYEVSMKPIKNDGVVSSFFTYTGPTYGDPWDEIDIEFLGKDTTKVQFNYFTNGEGNHEYLYDLGFDATEEFHTYGFRWSSDSIVWLVDGEEVYTATENIPSTPGKLMMNVWNGIGVDAWLKPFDGTTPLTAEYQWARFTEE